MIYFTVYDKEKRPLALIPNEIIDRFMIKINNSFIADSYTRPESMNQWYLIKQNNIEMYVRNLEHASSILYGEFKSNKIRDESPRQIL